MFQIDKLRVPVAQDAGAQQNVHHQKEKEGNGK
jgi:hypothetical protein